MTTADELRAVVPGLDSLPDATLGRLARAAVERRFPTGAVLYHAGDAAAGLFIVLAGRVRVSRESLPRAKRGGSKSQVLHAEGPGGVLGEIPVFGGGSYPATATAAEPTRCAHIPAEAVERLLREEPGFGRFALRRIAIRARSLLTRIDELTARTIPARVAEFVLKRAEEAPGASFTLGMSQAALAEELGTAREVVVRALGALVDAGAIRRVGRSRFAVGRIAVLRALAGGAGPFGPARDNRGHKGTAGYR